MYQYYVTYWSKFQPSLTGDVEAMRDSVLYKTNTIEAEVETTPEGRPTPSTATMLYKIAQLQTQEVKLCEQLARLTMPEDKKDWYTTFQIPKASGGLRTIYAPVDEVKVAQRLILDFLTKTCKVLSHNAVHSYVKGRNCKSALAVHKAHNARWFLKLDIKDFFPSCDTNTVLAAMDRIYPLCYLPHIKRLVTLYCFLDGALPQGAPTSPLLSNIVLLPMDVALTKELRGYCYTRYADDILISKTSNFKFTEVQNKIQELLGEKFILKKAKTRYGSLAGSNWNLGLMYNKDTNITVGYRQKHYMKNAIHNLAAMVDAERDTDWYMMNEHVKGLFNYYMFIEPDYFTSLKQRYMNELQVIGW